MSLSMITGLIPKIEGFQPIPNAVMIPFMETQSAALAFGFGLNYEFGKRTIRSMSNEKFNSLTSEQVAEMSAQHSTVLLNRFIQAVPQVMPAQTEIFKQYVTIEKAKVIQNFQLAKWTLADLPGILLGLGINIKDLSSTITNTPSKTGTTIIQDKEGNVTTTQAPVQHEVQLTENLPLADKPQNNIGGKIIGTTTATMVGNMANYISFMRNKDEIAAGWKDHMVDYKRLISKTPTPAQIVELNKILKTNSQGFTYFRFIGVYPSDRRIGTKNMTRIHLQFTKR